MRITKRGGFTLIESLIASVLLAVCVVGISGVLIATSMNAQSSDASLLAAERSQVNLEALAAKRLNDYSAAAGVGTTETIASSQLANPGDYSATTTGIVKYITRNVSQAPRDLALVSVQTTTPQGSSVTLYRIVTRAEMLK